MKKVINNIGDSRVIRFAKTHKKEIALVVCGGITGAVIHKKLMPNDVKEVVSMMYECRKGSKSAYGMANMFTPGTTIKDLGSVGEKILAIENTPCASDTRVTSAFAVIFTK